MPAPCAAPPRSRQSNGTCAHCWTCRLLRRPRPRRLKLCLTSRRLAFGVPSTRLHKLRYRVGDTMCTRAVPPASRRENVAAFSFSP
ncbi:hypothetical protein CBM2585_B50198 [Cupriavidus taiwanensis]|nr:hypothetical protein CBM2585_B50198 [Cupriavidus taiwanensis]